MASLNSALKAVAYSVQRAHGHDAAIILTRVGMAPEPVDATVYRERTEWRKTKDDREQVLTRRVVLPPSAAAVPIGSLFSYDGDEYTVDHVSSTAYGSQTLRGTRSGAATVSRPGYYGRPSNFSRD